MYLLEHISNAIHLPILHIISRNEQITVKLEGTQKKNKKTSKMEFVEKEKESRDSNGRNPVNKENGERGEFRSRYLNQDPDEKIAQTH